MRHSHNYAQQTIPIWGVLSVALIPVMLLCVILGMVTIDASMERPGSVSMTTLLLEKAYPTALVMKVCVVQWVA